MFMNPLKDSLGLIVILVIVLVIFGPSQLPKLGKMFGKTMKSVRSGMEDTTPDDEDEAPAKPKEMKATAEEAEAPPKKEAEKVAEEDAE